MLRRSVLIFHLGALGDFVLTWPIALAAGRLFPQSRIHFVTHGQKGKLAERALNLESVDIESGWHALFSDASALPEAPRRLLAGAHTIISFVSTPDEAWARNVQQLAPHATLMALRTPPPSDWTAHATEHLLSQLVPWPAMHSAVGQILRSVAERGVGLRRTPGHEIVIHPGSGSRQKCWPAERFADVAHRLRKAGHAVKILLGEAELERLDPADVRRFDPIPIHRPVSYVELLEQLQAARVALMNDSGPGHLAGIIGVPTLSLFGPTDPTVWRPLGPCVQILRRDCLNDLTVDEVYQTVLDLLTQ